MEREPHDTSPTRDIELTPEQQRDQAERFLELAQDVRRRIMDELGLPLMDGKLTRTMVERLAIELEHKIYYDSCTAARIPPGTKIEVLTGDNEPEDDPLDDSSDTQ